MENENKNKKNSAIRYEQSRPIRERKNRLDRIKVALLEKFSNKANAILILIPLIFALLLIVAIIVQLTVLAGIGVRKKQYLEEADKINEDLAYRIEEVNDEYVTKRIKSILNQNDLYVYTNSFWKYKLTANGVVLDDMEASIKGKDSSVEITLIEERLKNPLPDDVMNIGSVTRGDEQDKIQRHISVSFNGKTETVPTVVQDDKKSIYKFNVAGVKVGEKILIEISDQLGSKLKTPFNNITVTVS